MTGSIKKNYIYNTANQLLAVLTPLITVPYLSRALGAEGIGFVSFSQSVVAYFVLFASLGINLYATRAIAGKGADIYARSALFFSVKIFTLSTTVISLSVYAVFALHCSPDYRLIYFILGLNIVAVFLDVSWFFQGIEDFSKIFFSGILIKVLDIAYIFVFVHQKSDVFVYAFGIALIALLGQAVLWPFLYRHIVIPERGDIHPFSNVRAIVLLFLPVLAIQVYVVLDKTMLGLLIEGTVENGYYEQAQKIAKVALVLVTSLAAVMMPRIVKLFVQGNKKELTQSMYRSFNFVLALGFPICFGLMGVSDNFVPWFLGTEFLPVALLLKLTALLIIAIAISNVIGIQYLIPTMRQNQLTISVVCGAVVNFSLNLVLIPFFASVGAVIASVIAEAAVTGVQAYFVREEFSFRAIAWSSRNYLIGSVLMLSLLMLENAFLAPSIVATFSMIISGGCCYVAYLFAVRDELFLGFMKSVLR